MREHSFNSLGPGGFHRVHYYEWGDPQNPRVVLCVHGLTRNGRDFDLLAGNLSDRFRVICPDVIGRGNSGWLSNKEHYGYPQYCADMAALIARSGAQSVDWVGTSMGGIIGMLMASHAGTPVRRLVINDVGAFIPKAALERIKAYVGKHVTFDSFDEARRLGRGGRFSLPFRGLHPLLFVIGFRAVRLVPGRCRRGRQREHEQADRDRRHGA